jgi:reticulon-4-interacting protein 1, mitochondrial
MASPSSSSTTTKVQAWTYTTPSHPPSLTQTTLTVPSVPATNHILVQPHAASLNPVDIQLMNFPFFGLSALSYPKIPGRDFSGTVLAACPQTGFKKGDEVMGLNFDMMTSGPASSGTLATILHLNLSHPNSCVVHKPLHLSWNQAAALPLVYLTAKTAITKCAPFVNDDNGKRLVVLGGSSATGMWMVFLARQLGWEVLSTCSSRNADFVRARGASKVIDYTTEDVVGAVRDFKPAAIMDCVGGVECIGLADQYVSIVGDKTSRATMGGAALYLVSPLLWLRWLWGYLRLGKSYELINFEAKQEWLREVAQLDAGDVLVDSTFPLAETKQAYERLDTARARGKIIVEMP